MEFGQPCGNSGREVCCSRTPKAAQMDSIPPVIISPLPPSPLLIEGIPESSIAAISNDLAGCPADSSCINYRFCANGFMTDVPSGFEAFWPFILELVEFETPCGSAVVCCKRLPTPKPTETTVATLITSIQPPTEAPILSFFEADSTTFFPEINET